MNEIKFKGLDRNDGKVKDVERIDFMNELVLFKGEDAWVDFNNAEFMQYTGLKDKNSIEIYEGYKLRVISSSIDGECHTWETVIESILDFDIMKNLCYSNEIQIIGNIYEDTTYVN